MLLYNRSQLLFFTVIVLCNASYVFQVYSVGIDGISAPLTLGEPYSVETECKYINFIYTFRLAILPITFNNYFKTPILLESIGVLYTRVNPREEQI